MYKYIIFIKYLEKSQTIGDLENIARCTSFVKFTVTQKRIAQILYNQKYELFSNREFPVNA